MQEHTIVSLGEALYGEGACKRATPAPAASPPREGSATSVWQGPAVSRRICHETCCQLVSADCLADQIGKPREEVTSW